MDYHHWMSFAEYRAIRLVKCEMLKAAIRNSLSRLKKCHSKRLSSVTICWGTIWRPLDILGPWTRRFSGRLYPASSWHWNWKQSLNSLLLWKGFTAPETSCDALVSGIGDEWCFPLPLKLILILTFFSIAHRRALVLNDALIKLNTETFSIHDIKICPFWFRSKSFDVWVSSPAAYSVRILLGNWRILSTSLP